MVLVPVLFVIGLLLKNTPKVPDWLIPWVLLTVSVALTTSLIDDPVQGVIQGVLVAGATVMGHQLIKQTVERK